jgi:Family of unknown function (DUF6714)
MTTEESRTLLLVQAAFRNVRLGEGIGLRQADGLDDRADSGTLAAYRAEDEKDDWSAISIDDLDRYHWGIAFLDAEGMRFHLPAYLCADLRGDLISADIIFHLVVFEHLGVSRFALLNKAQRSAVREFLLLRLADPNEEFAHPMIEKALREYWNSTQQT